MTWHADCNANTQWTTEHNNISLQINAAMHAATCRPLYGVYNLVQVTGRRRRSLRLNVPGFYDQPRLRRVQVLTTICHLAAVAADGITYHRVGYLTIHETVTLV